MKSHAKACVSFSVYIYIIIIEQLIIQDHDLQRSPVAFLPRNRERDKDEKAIKHRNMRII